jgi:multidrug efflux pump subunit AcrA (membrane-fusion protein)
VAQADAIRAAIAKKNIRAPFAGHLGIRLVNLGQILNEGEPIVRETSSKDRTHESAADTI